MKVYNIWVSCSKELIFEEYFRILLYTPSVQIQEDVQNKHQYNITLKWVTTLPFSSSPPID